MRVKRLMCLLVLVAVGAVAQPHVALAQLGGEDYWPQWRGPDGTGSASSGTPPLSWGEETNIPLEGLDPRGRAASPIVWGDRVFILTATPTGESGGSGGGLFTRLRRRVTGGIGADEVQRYSIMALARVDGRVLWERVATEELPHEGRHRTGTWASPSGVVDEEQVCAFFGSRGLFCYDLDDSLSGNATLVTWRSALGLGRVPRQCFMAIRSWSTGTTRGSPSSPLSISTPEKNGGAWNETR